MLSINMNQVLGDADHNQHGKQGGKEAKKQRVLEQEKAAEFQLLAQQGQGGRPHKEWMTGWNSISATVCLSTQV